MAIHHLSITLAPAERHSAGCPSSRFGSLPVHALHLLGMKTDDLGLEPLMGVEELADYLGVPVQTIYDWRLSGTAPRAFKFGKRLKFAVCDVRSWLVEHQEADR